jgi:hypothetical protein
MAITKHKSHDDCQVQIRIGPFGPHHAQLYCTHHNVHIQWLDKSTVEVLNGFFQPKEKPKAVKPKKKLLTPKDLGI